MHLLHIFPLSPTNSSPEHFFSVYSCLRSNTAAFHSGSDAYTHPNSPFGQREKCSIPKQSSSSRTLNCTWVWAEPPIWGSSALFPDCSTSSSRPCVSLHHLWSMVVQKIWGKQDGQGTCLSTAVILGTKGHSPSTFLVTHPPAELQTCVSYPAFVRESSPRQGPPWEPRN